MAPASIPVGGRRFPVHAHPCIAARTATGKLRLDGMYFHVAKAQAHLLDRARGTFTAVRPRRPLRSKPMG